MTVHASSSPSYLLSRSNFGSRAADVIVVGAGHAGCEAALAAARLGKNTLLITNAIDRIGAMSCNPAIGGVGKGHIVKELDILGGEMGRAADATGIHFRTLNESRGPAVRATRCQSDMDRYQKYMSRVVKNTPNLRLRQDDVVGVHVEEINGKLQIAGIRTRHGEILYARTVVLTTGTFLGGVLHRGSEQWPGGRAGEAPAYGLTDSLKQHGIVLGRLKTGTCPRLDSRSIDYSTLEEQHPDTPAPRFSFGAGPPPLPQVSCFLTTTTKQTHQVILDAVNTGIAPLFNGQLSGRGPRYCPSIEDKVVRFAHKESHHIFLEPHGLDTYEVYPNGLSTSLPPQVQLAFLRTLPGLADVEVTRWGYAVEYDFVEPTQLYPSLETKHIGGLYCAGQLNGTTGYEEAAGQGLMAGINAARALDGKAPIVVARHQGYIGVLVDDLVTLGTEEPYRMMTSRAEHRLILREDNVHIRLLELSHEIGLADGARLASMRAFEDKVQREVERITLVKATPTPERQEILAKAGTSPMNGTTTLAQLARRAEIEPPQLLALEQAGPCSDVNIAPPETDDAAQQAPAVRYRAVVEVKYAGFLDRAQKEIERDKALADAVLPAHLFEERLPGISYEVFEKLRRIRPQTLGQAARISGITPAAVGLLAVACKRALHDAQNAPQTAQKDEPPLKAAHV